MLQNVYYVPMLDKVKYLNELYFSLQSDFLLIVLKNLVEKRSNQQGRKLKVILM